MSENSCELFETCMESVAFCISLYELNKLNNIVNAQFVLFISRALPTVNFIISP